MAHSVETGAVDWLLCFQAQ